jgi:serine protease AprX
MRRTLPTLLVTTAMTAVLALPAAAGLIPSVTTATIDSAVSQSSGTTDALLHLAPGVTADQLAGPAALRGVTLGSVFEAIGVVHARGSSTGFTALAATGLLSHVEEDAAVTTFTETSHQATRGQELLDGAITLPSGAIIDGTGVGVAVVDSGIDDTHPDLTNVARNVKAVPLFGGAVALPATDVISLGGHGTHVAGIVAGTGAASNGEIHGAATGATLYGVSAGTLISVHSGLESLEWVLDNHDLVSPAIRVVNNSWGSSGSGTPNPNSALGKMIDALVNDGVVVVWAAGNDGGNGSSATTSPTCAQQTPGNICVAAYDDQNTGTRTGSIAGFSSRGTNGQTSTYPDIAAPGANILATCRPYLPICATGFTGSTSYASLSGTSMAAPHIAGIVAQLLQVAPSLTPAQVEDLLEDTARRINEGLLSTDPANPTTPVSHDAGHGLVDVRAAVEALLGL